MAGQIGYNKSDVTKLFLVWLPVFAGLVYWNISVARNDSHGSVPVLNGLNALVLMLHWGACLLYSLVIFTLLRDGQRFWRFPVFIMLQLGWLVFDQGSEAFDFVQRTWHNERYMLAPFVYSLLVYLLIQVFRNRIYLKKKAARGAETLNEDERPDQ